MTPLLRILLFATLFTAVLSAGHYYLWKRIIRDAALPSAWHKALSWTSLLLAGGLLLVVMTARAFPRESVEPFAFAAFGWLGFLSTFFWCLVVGEALLFFYGKLRPTPKEPALDEAAPVSHQEAALVVSPEKRTTLRRILAGGVALSGASVGSVAVAKAIAGFKVVEVAVELDRLPKAFDGFRIVQMSDVHVGPTIGVDFVRHMVETANSLRPDLMAITGDLVDGSVENLGRHTAPLSELKAPHGSFFVTGNHEYYSGAEEWMAEVSRLGIRVLRNESERILRGADSFLLAGVTDHRAGGFGDPPDLARALRSRKKDEEVVLLAHQPRELDRARKEDVGLQISGHTHGGQFWPWNWLVYLVQPVVAGLERFGRTQIYVNSGTGYWGPPMRLGTDSEITVITLRSKT